jgi:chitodextrinase
MNVLAYWHHPRFSSGMHGSDPTYEPFWQALYDAGADVVLTGHDHDYERFAPQDATGIADQTYGIRQFVVGTGGASVRPFNPTVPNSEVRDASSFGILELTLSADSYAWQFLPVTGGTFSDAGQASTHPAPPHDGNAPSVPTGLMASEVSVSAVTLTWSAATDDVAVTGYEVLRNGAAIAFSGATGFTDPDVLAAQTYEYRVRARDAAGNWSALSTAFYVTTPSPAGSVTVMISADTLVRADKPTTNYGAAIGVEVDGSPQKAILLQANVSGLNGRGILSARLYLYCIDPSTVGGEVHRMPTTWSESTVTWNTTPAADPGVVATLGPVNSGSWYQLDLTGAIEGDGTYAFMIVSTSSNGADYVSREGAPALRPSLLLELTP